MASVVFVNRAGRFSGAEVVLLNLVQIACERGYHVRVVCPIGPLADRLPESVEHFTIDELDLGGSSGISRAIAAITLVRRWIRAAAVIRRVTDDDDKVMVNSLLALPAARLARLSQGVAWLVHDTVYEAKQRLMIRIGRPAVRRAFAVSPPTADAVRELGLDVGVTPLGVELSSGRAPRHGRPVPVIGIMALMTPWKGHRILLQAVAKVPGVRCEIAGTVIAADVAYADELHRLAESPELNGRVEFLGHVDPISTMAAWDVLVNASTSPEASPVSALEAMSVGLPIIATDHGGCSWLLRDGAGMLVAPGSVDALAEAIEWAVNNPDAMTEIADRAYERVVTTHDAAVAFPAMLDALLATEGLRCQ